MKKEYQALTYVNLPYNDDPPKVPGTTITKEELEAANQTDENVAQLIADGALGDPGDDLHPDHRNMPVTTVEIKED